MKRILGAAVVVVLLFTLLVSQTLATDVILRVKKFAFPELERTWEWTIDKTATKSELVLSPGQMMLVEYTVTVDAIPGDSGWAVSGYFDITNLSEATVTVTSVSDVVSPDIAATITGCVHGSPPFDLPSGHLTRCYYSTGLPDGATRTNTATVHVGSLQFSDTAEVNFADATVTDEIDECIDVRDSFAGSLGTVCWGDAPRTFTYSRYIGPYKECGAYRVDNLASFVTNDTGTTGESMWTIEVDVPCDKGCTLTPGYWKTHSEYGPAPYDDTWAQLANGADTPFFLSGQTYYDVLWTEPQGGNAYYILAHAYIAAELNVLNGASIPDGVLNAWNAATVLFQTYTPADIDALKGNDDLRGEFVDLAEILDDYNNGITGPGHCSE